MESVGGRGSGNRGRGRKGGGAGGRGGGRKNVERKPGKGSERATWDKQGQTRSELGSPSAKTVESELSETGLQNLVPARIDKKCNNKRGILMPIEVNHFSLTLRKPNITVYQYDVEIQPNVPKYMIRLAWNEFVRRNFPRKYPSFDGNKIAVSASPLIDKYSMVDEFKVNNPETDNLKDYSVEIKLAKELNLDNLARFLNSKNINMQLPMAELAVIDIVLRNYAANTLIRAGRSLFPRPKGNIRSLGGGMEAWCGYYQSAILGWKIFLNFDVSHKGFPMCDVLKTVQEICLTDLRGTKPLTAQTTIDSRDLKKLEKHLKSLKVEYEIPRSHGSKRVYKINGVRDRPACKERFKLENNVETDVVRYYSEVKNYKIKYPNLPCLWVGSPKNRIYVPMELCTVVAGQAKNGKLDPIQTSNMIRIAADPPDVRKIKIMEQFREANLSNEFTDAFGISVAGEFEKIDARILDPPKLESGSRDVHVQRGKWELNRFVDPKPLKNWCILTLDDRSAKFEKAFVKEINEQAKLLGMAADGPIFHGITFRYPLKPQAVIDAFSVLKNKGVSLAFVVIPDKGDFYSMVKQISEIEVGVLTQCIRSSTMHRTFSYGDIKKSTLSNILLKVNAKLNGVNHALHINSRPRCMQKVTMIVGADVTHPSPDAKSLPSIAAVAASYDTKATQYHTIRRLQPSTKEMIVDMREIMKEQLLYFYRKNALKPEKIIVYRDGVSEGQINEILLVELKAIQQACIDLQTGDNKMDYQPQITFLIVQKRHHTRFFPAKGNKFCNEKNPNVPAGTCVDTVVVHPRDLDFYLVSHMSRLGTARPTKYKLIYDDSDMTEDELEHLSFYLCHLVARCTMAISYPAPTYYAHLAAFRARAHLVGIDVDMSTPAKKAEGEKKIVVKNYFSEKAPMFYV